MQTSLFGTDGIRSKVGTWPLDPENLTKLAHALGLWIKKNYGNNARVLLAHDTRISGQWIKSHLSSILLLHSYTLFDASVISTPAACFLMKYTNHYDCAIMISASHNGYEDNGIKIIKKHGHKLTEKEEVEISSLFFTYSTSKIDYLNMGTIVNLANPLELYIDHLKSLCPPTAPLQGKTIVLDCANGAVSSYAQQIFSHLGAKIIACNTTPDGKNINKECGAAHPKCLQRLVIAHNADLGFGFDGDADRIIAVNSKGVYKDGDDLLCLLLQHPLYVPMQTVIGTVMTNQGFELYLNGHKKKLVRTAVGDKYIAQMLDEKDFLLGGESSGHIIMNDFLPTSDGIALALRICNTIAHTDNWQMETFQKVPHILINMAIKEKISLDHDSLKTVIDETKAQLPYGRILIRYSGTEPLLRILIEDPDIDHASFIGNKLSKQLEKFLT